MPSSTEARATASAAKMATVSQLRRNSDIGLRLYTSDVN